MTKSFWNEEFCTDSLNYYKIPGLPHPIGILMLIYGVLHIVMSLITVFWIKSNEREAQAEYGKEDAAKSVIFPVFLNFLWANIVVNIVSGLIVVFFPLNPINHNGIVVALLYSAMWASQHVVNEGIAFVLMQKGCGQHAANRAARLALIWGLCTFLVMYYIFSVSSLVGGLLDIGWDTLMLVFYLTVWHAPEELIFRRPAAIFYSKFWSCFRMVTITINVLVFFRQTQDVASCGIILVQIALVAVLQPLICYWTLLRDSRWWQGLDFNGDDNQNADEIDTIRAPLMGSDFSLTSAQSLADTMDRMRIHAQVKMLNFACIKVNFHKPLGSGSFSKVYQGKYRGKNCAIKLIYTVDLTEDVIKRVAAEASILSAMRNPNIVNILGVSVLPPSVCLILELCSFGSLSDVIRGYGFDWNMSHSAPLELCRLDVLYLSLGCARGLAAVHSFDPSVCHRDVKSFNFLVDHRFTVKIADLELGTGKDGNDTGNGDKSWTNVSRSSQYSPMSTPTDASSQYEDSNVLVVEDLLANWMAPDVLRNKRFQQASDIHSLGTVLWEIVTRQLPFEHLSQPEIRQLLLSGYRHPLPDLERATVLGTIIKRCWQDDPDCRPTAQEIVQSLEEELENVSSKVIAQVYSCPDVESVRKYYTEFYKHMFPAKINTSMDLESAIPDLSFGELSQSRRSRHTRAERSTSMLNAWNPFKWLFPDKSFRRTSMSTAKNLSARYAPHEDALSRAVISTHEYHSLMNPNDDSEFVEPLDEESANRQANAAAVNRIDPQLQAMLPAAWNLSHRIRPSEISSIQSSEISDFINANANTNDSDDELEDHRHDMSNTHVALQAQMPKAAYEAIRQVKQEKFWSALERADEAWAVITTDYPHVILHATSRWYEMFEVPSSFGNDYHLLSLLSLIAPGIEARKRCSTASNHYVQDAMHKRGEYRRMRLDSAEDVLEGLKRADSFHGILCLHVPSAISRYHNSVSTASRGKSHSLDPSKSSDSRARSISHSAQAFGHNLMCSLHAYPVFAPPSTSFSSFSERKTTAAAADDSTVASDSTSTLSKSSKSTSPRPSEKGSFAEPRPSFLSSVGSYSPIRSMSPKRSASENRVPMYFAVLFHELKEIKPTPPEEDSRSHTNTGVSNIARERPASQPYRRESYHSWGVADTLGRFWSRASRSKPSDDEEDDDDDEFGHL